MSGTFPLVERIAVLVRRIVLATAVLLVALGAAPTVALAAAASPGPGAAPKVPTAAEVEADAASGEVEVLAVTRAPGEAVVDEVVGDAPVGSVTDVEAGSATVVAATVDAAGLDALQASDAVERILPNRTHTLAFDPWVDAVGVPQAHAAGWDGTGRTIAVLDSGVQADHPYLAGKVTAEACFSRNSSLNATSSLCPGGAEQVLDTAGAAAPCSGITGCDHGTHVAGIAVGGPVSSPRDLEGVAPGASVVAVKVFTKGTSLTACGGVVAPCLLAYDSDIIGALDWLAQRRAAGDPRFTSLVAANLSLGGGLYASACDLAEPSTPYIGTLKAMGVATVAATGNNGSNGSSGTTAAMASPACISSVVSVGSVSATGSLASYSNATGSTTLLAPGTSVTSSVPGSGWLSRTGTSMATPMVSGALAVLRQRDPGATVDQLVTQLRTNGTPVVTPSGSVPALRVDAAVGAGPERVPSPPSALSLVPGDGQIAVSWAPSSYQGDGFAGYRVTSSPGTSTCETTATGCTLTGLSNGQSYAVAVTARNTVGTSSPAVGASTPRTVPAAPTGVVASPLHGAALVSWSAPSSNGGAPITSYHVTASPGGNGCDTASTSCVVPGLTVGAGYTFVVSAHNAAGGGPASTPSAAVTVTGPPGPPVGSWDVGRASVGSVSVAGWALDPEASAPIAVHVYIDGVGRAVVADGARPDVAAAFPGYGAAHGFAGSWSVPGGRHTVCVYAINVGVGDHTSLGCRFLDVPAGSPVGGIDSVVVGPTSVALSGWAIDPDTAAPIDVHVYVDGVGRAVRADVFRSDVAGFFGPYGGAHGFQVDLPVGPGPHTLCAYGIDVGVGSNSLLGCRSFSTPTGPPIGYLDLAIRNLDGTIRVAGWAIDPDTASPIAVHVYVEGPSTRVGHALLADGSRPDVGAALPLYGSPHGFSATLGAPAGARVCAYGINVGGGANSLLGCRTVA